MIIVQQIHQAIAKYKISLLSRVVLVFFLVLCFVYLLFNEHSYLLAHDKYLLWDPANGPLPPLSEIYDTVENRALAKQRREDPGQISIRQVTVFHKMFLDRCMKKLPAKVKLQYDGIVRETRPIEEGIDGDDGIMQSLSWDVIDSISLFSFSLSTERSNSSIVELKIDNEVLFVNIDHVVDGQSVNKKLKQLNDRSIREIFDLLKSKTKKEQSKSK